MNWTWGPIHKKHLSKEYILKHSLWVIVFLFIFSSIAQAQVKAGGVPDALEAAKKIENPYSKVWTFIFIAQTQAEASDIDGAKVTLQRALEAAEESKNSYFKALALIFIAQAQAKALDIEGAKVTFQRALRTARKN